MGGYQVGSKKNNNIRLTLIENGVDPDLIRDFLEEQIEWSRSTDKISENILDKNEFYKRELKYTQIELFIMKLKLK